MKVAIIHDYLNQYGGAERVLEQLLEIFPKADIYTIFYDEERTHGRFRGQAIYTSFLDWSFIRRHHRWFIPLMPLATRTLRLTANYDLIFSASAGYAKGINHHQGARHVAYCYTPLRYAWEPEYLRNLQFPISNFQLRKIILKPILQYLRWWDYRAGQKPEKILTLSHHIAGKIKNYYGRSAEVLYPPFDNKKFFFDPAVGKKDYYLAAGRLMHYKNFDIIIESFNKLKLPLKIIGIGPEKERLRKLIKSPLIEMFPFVGDDEMRTFYQEARAFIFANSEDFGLVMVEAQACGTPVIAFRGGGALEIVEEGKTGLFFEKPTALELVRAVQRFQKITFDPLVIVNSVNRFTPEKFKEKLTEYLK